jgi:hypothetical protein
VAEDRAAAFKAAAQALNAAGDKDLRNEVYAAFRKATKPLGESIIREGSAEMPRGGGLAARVAAAKMGQSNSTTGRNPGVALSFRTKPGTTGQSYNLRALDAGIARHPTFGNRAVWRVTSIRAGAFTRPFEAGKEPVAQQVLLALEKVAQQIARTTTTGRRAP